MSPRQTVADATACSTAHGAHEIDRPDIDFNKIEILVAGHTEGTPSHHFGVHETLFSRQSCHVTLAFWPMDAAIPLTDMRLTIPPPRNVSSVEHKPPESTFHV